MNRALDFLGRLALEAADWAWSEAQVCEGDDAAGGVADVSFADVSFADVFFHWSGSHSSMRLTDSDGDVVERYDYDPYGKTYIQDPTTGGRRTASAFGNPFAWTAQRYDDAGVGLYNFPFRTYSTRLGRRLQPCRWR